MNIYFGENLKRLRLKRNLTQEKLADFLGVSFQTVSKWERGDTYPDITMLPEIAAFFKVSVDDLLGVNRSENEAEIIKKIEEYDNLTDEKIMWELITDLKEKYPNDFRVLLRYMGHHIFYFKDITEHVSKLISIYENIQQNCTVDKIRICAKRYLIYLYERLSKIEGSGVTFEDCEKIIREMPRMRDGREMFCFIYPKEHPEHYESIQEAMEEEILILENTLTHYWFWNERLSLEYRIEIQEKIINAFDFLYDDGNYSRTWRKVIDSYGRLGHFYFAKGDNEKAILNLKKCAELAVKFDSLDRITTLHSTLFEGKVFDKDGLGSTFIAKSRVKELMTERYPLSDEFKATKEFQDIIKILDT